MAMSQEVRARLNAMPRRDTISGFPEDEWLATLIEVAGFQFSTLSPAARLHGSRSLTDTKGGDPRSVDQATWCFLRNVSASRIRQLMNVLPHNVVSVWSYAGPGKGTVRTDRIAFPTQVVTELLHKLSKIGNEKNHGRYSKRYESFKAKNVVLTSDRYVATHPGIGAKVRVLFNNVMYSDSVVDSVLAIADVCGRAQGVDVRLGRSSKPTPECGSTITLLTLDTISLTFHHWLPGERAVSSDIEKLFQFAEVPSDE